MRFSYAAIFFLIPMSLLAVVAVPTFALLEKKSIRGEVRNVADYSSIQEAIDSLPNTGGTVFIPAGTYVISVPIKVHSNVSLVGTGFGTVLVLADGANCNVIENANPAMWQDRNILIRDMRIDGNGRTQTQPSNGIFLYTAPYSRVENVWVHNFPRYTISAGIFIMLSPYTVIQNNIAEKNDYTGIFVSWSDDSVVSSNQLRNNHRGIYVSFSNYVEVNRNTIVNCDEGIRLYGTVSYNRVFRNYIEASSDEGIVIMHPTCENNLILNNRLANNFVHIGDGGTNTNIRSNKMSQ